MKSFFTLDKVKMTCSVITMFFVFLFVLIPEIDARAPLTLQSIAVLLYYLMNFPTCF